MRATPVEGTSHVHGDHAHHHLSHISVIEKVSAVALGAFSLYTDWQLFVPFFFVGVAIGVYSSMTDEPHEGHSHPSSCALGFLEQLTGVRLPPKISLIVNLASTACHIDHHATVFVPIIAVSMGSWMGHTAYPYVRDLDLPNTLC